MRWKGSLRTSFPIVQGIKDQKIDRTLMQPKKRQSTRLGRRIQATCCYQPPPGNQRGTRFFGQQRITQRTLWLFG